MKRFMICANVLNCKMNTNENKQIYAETRRFGVMMTPLGSLSKHDVDERENVIGKCNFAFLQSFFNYSNSLCLKNVF